MLNKKCLLIITCIACLPTLSIAKPISLVESCVELVNIYESKNSQRLLAAQTTSLSEGLRAGYCLGVLTNSADFEYNCRSDWFRRAEFIATFSQENNRPSERKILKLSCEI